MVRNQSLNFSAQSNHTFSEKKYKRLIYNSHTLVFVEIFLEFWSANLIIKIKLSGINYSHLTCSLRVYVYHVFHWFAKKKNYQKEEKKVHHHTDFEADLWPETRDFFGAFIPANSRGFPGTAPISEFKNHLKTGMSRFPDCQGRNNNNKK